MAKTKIDRTIEVLDSEWVRAVGYDPDALVLEMTTKTGDRYRYYDVGSYEFSKVITAPSVGKAINDRIKGAYRRRKLDTVL